VRLESCPNCGKIDYQYGFGFLGLLSETAGTAITAWLDPKVLVGKVLSNSWSGLGLLSVPKQFYEDLFEDMGGDPLLRCKHCRNIVCRCCKCHTFFLLERAPKTAEAVECPVCKKKFHPSERSDDFDKLLLDQ